MITHQDAIVRPEPLPVVRRFLTRAVPVFVVFLAATAVTLWLSFEYATETAYAQVAARTVDALLRAATVAHPTELAQLLRGEPLPADAFARVDATLQQESANLQLVSLHIYGPNETQLYPTRDASTVIESETHTNIRRVLSLNAPFTGHPVAVDGTALHEIWVPLRVDGVLAGAIEVYEPTAFLDAVKSSILAPALAPALLVVAAWGIAMFVMAQRIQRKINERTQFVTSLNERVERLVSHRALTAMHAGEEVGKTMPRTITCTHLFTDVRGFTAFAERNVPVAVITTLNDIFSMQVGILEKAGADIDKFVGDAVFARFEGKQKERAAIDAALAIQRAVISSGIPFSIGIGIASGTVVAGLCGVPNRYDYTVVGDAVNVASRVCGEAKGNEILVDVVTANAAAFGGGDAEKRTVKGRVSPVDIRRIDCTADVGTA